MTFGSVSNIMRQWNQRGAATGESERWQTADGRVWRPRVSPELTISGELGTGDRHGIIQGNRIKEQA